MTGCARLEWTVLDGNAEALRFYRTMGAVVVGMDEWTVQRVSSEALARLAEITP